jgi:hypothetical protein
MVEDSKIGTYDYPERLEISEETIAKSGSFIKSIYGIGLFHDSDEFPYLSKLSSPMPKQEPVGTMSKHHPDGKVSIQTMEEYYNDPVNRIIVPDLPFTVSRPSYSPEFEGYYPIPVGMIDDQPREVGFPWHLFITWSILWGLVIITITDYRRKHSC